MPYFYLMCGLPGSGKTTKAKEIVKEKNAVYLSSDSLRKELYGNENDQEHNEEGFVEMNKRAAKALENGENVVYDSCNVSYKRRMALIQQLKRYKPIFICVVCYCPYRECLKNNDNRERVVPHGVIRHMMMNFYFPQIFEGWDCIDILVPENMKPEKSLVELFYGDDGLCKIAHDNPHHSLTIGNHCAATFFRSLIDHPEERYTTLHMAALLHDIGKPFCKDFKDSKGNETTDAHYYQHHLVSAYFAFPYICESMRTKTLYENLEILALIDYHMHPYFWEKDNNEKMRNKYFRLWGEQLFNKIMMLHKADDQAH